MYDLKLIKKYYGEEMMHFARELFPDVLETEGLLYEIISSLYAPNHVLYNDIVNNNLVLNFKDFIYSLIDTKMTVESENSQTPFTLMNEAGYDLYECKIEEEIQEFKKYYQQNEQLCTFSGNRLKNCYVFFAVKKNVEQIKRENFSNPMREDEYGTSVISIQFYRGRINNVSIKNRYNHTVKNPDATFSNNLDNIIPGLTDSFIKYYGFNVHSNNYSIFTERLLKLDYVLGNDGKFYRYNCENNGVYFCLNNIIIDNGKVIKDYINKARYIFIDELILDLKKKLIIEYKNTFYNSFIDTIPYIDSIDVKNNKQEKTKNIFIKCDKDEIIIILDSIGRIIKYSNPRVQNIDDRFLEYNKSLKEIDLPNVENIGDYFLKNNRVLSFINMPKVEIIGNFFLQANKDLKELEFPCLKLVNDYFMESNNNINKIYMPNLEKVGSYFLQYACILDVDFPNLKDIKYNFMRVNKVARRIILPKVEKIYDQFFQFNKDCIELVLPETADINASFITIDRMENEVIKSKLLELKIKDKDDTILGKKKILK